MPNAKRDEQIDAFGGACQRCGYNRCRRALHFHHVERRIGKSGHVDIREVKDHPQRFELVCANCHIEIHEAADEAVRVRRVCPVCSNSFVPHGTGPSRAGRGVYCSRRCARSDQAMPIADRFTRHTRIEGHCVLWTGYAAGGVPIITVKGESGTYAPHSARAVAFELTHGERPPRKLRVTCGNSLCVNVDHFDTKPTI